MAMTLAALLPVILVIASGYLVAQTGLISKDQWRGTERVAYLVLFPAVLFRTISTADFAQVAAFGLGAVATGTILIMATVLMIARPGLEQAFGMNGPRFSSIFQGTLRWNGMIALAIADNILGEEGLAIMAIAMVFMIPLLNILSILVLSRYASGEPATASKLLRDIYTNPLLLSIGAGLLFNLSGLPMPATVSDTLRILAQASLPIAILCVGASLNLSALRRPGPALTLGTFLRPLLMPPIAYGLCLILGVTGITQTVLIIANAAPAASNAYLLAKQLGGDAELMAEIITLQTLAAAVTVPITVWLLG